MSDRDVEAQPGDNHQPELDDESLVRPAGTKPIEMPHKADVSQPQVRPLAAPTGREVLGSTPQLAQTHQIGIRYCPDCGSERAMSDTECLDCGHPFEIMHAPSKPAAFVAPRELTPQVRHVDEEPAADANAAADVPAARIALRDRPRRASRTRQARSTGTAAHPLSRLRLGERGRSLGNSFRALTPGSDSALRVGAANLRRSRPRPRLGIPSLRSLVGYAGLTATFGIVTALIVTLPSHPSAALSTGSVYGVNWHTATKAPFDKVDFGPYFVTADTDLLMVGTVGQTTTAWVTGDGTTWTQRSGSGAFGIDNHRFVAQGFSDDGQGGLVVVGNSIGNSSTDVSASAWHSTDGNSWAPMDVQGGKGQEMVGGVAARPGALVAAGNGVAWLSTDERSWSAQILPGASAPGGSYTPRAVGTWSGGFVIIGLWNGAGPTRSTAWYSATGADWKQAKTSLTGFDTRGIAGVNGRIVAGGIDLSTDAPGLAASWSSEDGNTWTKTTAPSDIATIAMDGLVKVGNGLVAYGAPAAATSTSASAAPATEAVWVTDDGKDWLPLTSTAAPLNRARMATLGRRLLLMGSSADGIRVVSGDLVMGASRAASSPTAPPGNYVLALQAGNSPMIADITKAFTLGPVTSLKERFYLFATGPTGTSIFGSADGLLWPQETAPLGLTKLVVAAPAAVASAQPSASGAPAQAQAVVTGRPVILQAVPDGKGGLLAVGKVTNTTGDNGMIWHMTKAGEWRQVNFSDDTPPEFASIAVAANGFVASADAAGGSKVMFSNDGDNWSAASIAVGDALSLTVATYKSGFVAVGTDPVREGATTAWTSSDGQTWTMRTDWKLPPNVSVLFGVGNTLIATADTVIPTPSASASASAPAKPTPTPAATIPSTTWWWSTTGLGWQKSGLQVNGDNWAFVNGQILVLDAPAKASGTWTAWSSPDGKTWQRPNSDPITFAGSSSCAIASSGSRVVVIGWEAAGVLKDYKGEFATQ
jgi:hypothetical protein